MSKLVYWTPRILSIIFIIFLAIFSLDVFDGSSGFWQILVGLFMHNIPVFVLLFVLFISWKREWVGGIAFISAGISYLSFALSGAPSKFVALSWSLVIAGTAFFIGVLFLIGWLKRKCNKIS